MLSGVRNQFCLFFQQRAVRIQSSPMCIISHPMFSDPDHTDPRITDQFHGSMRNVCPRSKQQHSNCCRRNVQRAFQITCCDRTVFPMDLAVFQIEKRHTVVDRRKCLQIRLFHTVLFCHQCSPATVSIPSPYAFPLPIPCIRDN